MRTSAVICEFNPLHRGHMHILSEMRKNADCVIAIMSGNFVQRAIPAVLDKYERAQVAILAGADLVLELPFPWCSASAEYFAKAGTAIAENIGAETLIFGIGAGDFTKISQAAEAFSDPFMQEEINKLTTGEDISQGIASIRERCLKSRFGGDFTNVLRSPNDILAIEYLLQIRRNGYRLKPQTVARLTVDTDPNFKSATVIREMLHDGCFSDIERSVPPFVMEILTRAANERFLAEQGMLTDIAFRAIRTDLSPFATEIAEGEGGLFRRIHSAAQKATSPDEMLTLSATKKYTNARIRRVLLYYLTKITPGILRETPQVTTVLAANEIGCAYLSSVRKTTPLTILTKPAAHRDLPLDLKAQYMHTINADRLYTLCVPCGREADYFLKQSPRIVK